MVREVFVRVRVLWTRLHKKYVCKSKRTGLRVFLVKVSAVEGFHIFFTKYRTQTIYF